MHPAHTNKGLTNVNTDKIPDPKVKVTHRMAPASTEKGHGNAKGRGVIEKNPAKANTNDNANQKDGNNSNSINNPYKLSDCNV